MTEASDKVTELEGLPGVLTIYGYKNVNFVIWDGPASVETAELMGRVTERRQRKHPEGLSVVHIVRAQVAMPDAVTRDALVKLMKEVEGAVVALAVVIGGTGFWASGLRSLVTGMKMLSRSSFEMRLHGRVEEVVAWLPAAHTKRTGVPLEASELLAALNQVLALTPADSSP
jgi:hypothetical protein